MARRPRSFGSKKLSGTKARACLAQLLSGCRVEQLKSFTAAGLASTHNVPLKTAEAMLAAAKIGRGL